jgi:TolB protein
LAYVSFESHYPAIYISDLATGKRELISKFQGINGAPAWAPDGKSIVLVLSKSGTPNLYRYFLKEHRLEQITFDDWINTEPSVAPDGQSLLFTSNRDGGPQIYEYNFARQKISRVSYIGNYNARATFTPDGEHIVFLHRDQGEFTIAWQDLSSGEMKLIVKADVDESPSLAPNGEMVVYSSRKRGYDVLRVASVNGRSVTTLPTGRGNVQEPAWAPFK